MELTPTRFFLICIVLFVAVGIAHLPERTNIPRSELIPTNSIRTVAFAPRDVTASSFIVFDIIDGTVFGEREASTTQEMASVVKLLTAEVALSTSTIDASTTVSWRAITTFGRAGHLVAHQEYRIRELVFPLLLESSNDAAEAIAEAHGRTAFIAHMNTRAQELGMTSTTIVDPSGLGPRNVSTAYDLMRLLQHLYTEHRHVLDITTLPSYVGTYQVWRNNDPVLSTEGFVGGKHGYTDTAGRTIALIVEEQIPGSTGVRPIGIVLLNSLDLYGDVAKLREELRRSASRE